MKKYIILSMIIGLLFSACNPNADIYDAIQETEKPYSQKFDIELTDADYTAIKKLALAKATTKEDSTIANDLATFKSFSSRRSPADLIPDFIAANYIALDSASSINVKYNLAVNDYDSITFYELTDEDYNNIGGSVADSLAFFQNQMPNDYLPALLTDTTSNYLTLVKSRFIKERTENVLTNVILIDTIFIPNDTLVVENDTIFTNYDTTFVEMNTQVLLPHTFYDEIDTSIVFTYRNGAWESPENSYVLSNADYESMGTPGNHHNFSDSDKPDHYIPDFLKTKDPFAFSGETVLVSYMYHVGGGVSIPMTTGYEFTGSEWVSSTNVINQFIHTGEKWIFDPTINYTMTNDDYQLIVDYVVNDPVLFVYKDKTYDNTEYYYGASSHYGNFDMRTFKRIANDSLNYLADMSEDEVKVEIFNRLEEAIVIFAEAKFPTQEPISNGTQVFYEIYYKTYEPGSHYYKMKIKCTDVGKFEYFSGPIEL